MTAVREFQKGDADMTLALMRDLARYEGYIDDFRVNTSDLIKNGLGPNRVFTAFVVPSEDQTKLLGVAVTYTIPWTYDLKPVLVLKELFVAEDARGKGIGKALFQHVLKHGGQCGASRLKWTVLTTNHQAKVFYRGLGGTQDNIWESWHLPVEPLVRAGRSNPSQRLQNI